MSRQRKVLVTGAGGFIGGHLTAELLREKLDEGRWAEVWAADVKPYRSWHQRYSCASNAKVDLNDPAQVEYLFKKAGPFDEVYHLAADMGGMGFIEANKAACMLNVQHSVNMLRAVRAHSPRAAYFFASTACVYRQDRQALAIPDRGLREDDVYPADPEDGYGWEKLFSERLCRHFSEDYGVRTRVARFHTIYGPKESWDGGREKVPAALCRKVAIAKLDNAPSIDVWGDGRQGRSFLYVDDAVRGILAVARGDDASPLNVGSPDLVSVDELAYMVMDIAGYHCAINHVPGPQGVRGRTADITKVTAATGWKPRVSLREGMTRTYEWVEEQVCKIHG